MSIKFKTITRKNPRDLSAPEKYYPSSVTGSVLDLNELADLVGDGSTVRRNDVYAVLIGLVDVAKKQLELGNMVRLGDLGSFSINVSSTGKDTAAEVTATSIEKGKIIFRPSANLKNMLKALRYEKVGESTT
ncbi:HU family DNA-binding protein [uncultured Kordia sp.]|uniref:HU family DNA-binding protein n=1 Tax=uncultured Kordia sp. TaxID=507699 RepID=UPI0026107E9F|nr:HU family DNA-binding protein [uncultured Kordia sp.]